MTDNAWAQPSLSYNALYLYAWLKRRGGSVRIRPLLRWSGLGCDGVSTAANELQARGWVEVSWRAPRPGLPERVRAVERLTITRHGHLFGPRRWLASDLAPPVRAPIGSEF